MRKVSKNEKVEKLKRRPGCVRNTCICAANSCACPSDRLKLDPRVN